MKTKIFYLAMYILAVLPLMTACESDEPTAIDEPNEQTQLATPVVTVNVDRNAKTITASWQAVEHADNYHYKISGDETLYKTGETRLELQPYSKFEGGSHSITVQAVSNAQPDLFSPSEWGKADFTVESTKLQAPEALNADVNKESCTVTVSWAPVTNAVSYLYKIDDGKEVPVSEPEISFSLFDYAPGEHSVSVKALAEGDAPTGRSASVKAVTAVASSDWSEVYTFTITDEPLPGMLGNKPLDHARLGDFYLNDGSLVRADSKLSEGQANACIGIVFYSGRHETDQSDYTRPLTEDGPVLGNTVHGYVMSLTYVPTQSRFEGGPMYENIVMFKDCNTVGKDGYADSDKRAEHLYSCLGTFHSEDDFNGYYNCRAILNYAATHNCCIFPALEAAINYGKRGCGWENRFLNVYAPGSSDTYWTTVDVGGIYDWQLSLAAPQSSSGWFLPSYGQLYYFCPTDSYSPLVPADRKFVRGQFEKVKNATTREELKEHIDPQYYSFAIHSYYSSSEWKKDGYCRKVFIYGNDKGLNYVRPVLAF